MADTEDRLLSVADVARLLSVTEPTVREWIKDGKLRAHRAGARFWRIRRSEVDRMLAQQASHRPADPDSPRTTTAAPARDLLASLITSPSAGNDGS
ncbi:MAG: helix-turn-helix domain-containing protein [Trebonia sp.]